MRLILKYRDVAGLGDAAQELVSFSQRTRALNELLHDPVRAGLVLVTLDEPVVVAESTRLATTLDEMRIAVVGVVVNRLSAERRQLATFNWPKSPILAPESDHPLIGADAITNWCERWRARD
jgi:anion-transporting  ArsA/GET3 family ATPase